MAQTANPANGTGWWERMVAGWRRFISSGLAKAVCALFDFFFNGHFILAAGKWVALVGARTAVTVLFFASLWVAGESTVHPFMVQIVSLIPFVTTATLDNLALTAFTWLPEIIVLEAILKTVFFGIDVIKGEKRVWSSIWGSIYLPLTGVFIYIAISTFLSYITTHATDQSNTGMLLFRALMAWMYSVIEMAYPAIHRKMYHEDAPAHAAVVPAPVTPPVDIAAIVNQALTEQAAKHEESLRALTEQQRLALDNLNQRQEQRNNLQHIEMQCLTAQVQQGTAVTPVSPEHLVDLVMQRFEAQFEAMIQQRVRVASAEQAPVPQAGRNNTTKQRAIRGQDNIVALPQAGRNNITSSVTPKENKTQQIFELLDNDSTLQPTELARLVGCDRTTAWRVLQRWQLTHSATVDSSDQGEQEGNDATDLDQEVM